MEDLGPSHRSLETTKFPSRCAVQVPVFMKVSGAQESTTKGGGAIFEGGQNKRDCCCLRLDAHSAADTTCYCFRYFCLLVGCLLLLPLAPFLLPLTRRTLTFRGKQTAGKRIELIPARGGETTPKNGAMEDGRAAEATPRAPAQPTGEAPLPPPPPSRPLEEEAPRGASLGESVVVAPTADAPVESDVLEEEGEEEEAQQESFLSRGSSAKHAFSLSGELVPVTAEGGDEDDTPNYYDWKGLFPELKALVDAMPEIAAECGRVAAWKAWPEKHYDEGGNQDWKVYIPMGVRFGIPNTSII